MKKLSHPVTKLGRLTSTNGRLDDLHESALKYIDYICMSPIVAILPVLVGPMTDQLHCPMLGYAVSLAVQRSLDTVQ